MRDYQAVFYYPERGWSVQTWDSLDKPGCSNYPRYYYNETTPTFPRLLKGRDNSKVGPAPYPTNYFGFRVEFQEKPRESFWISGRKYLYGCGFHIRTIGEKTLIVEDESLRIQGMKISFADGKKIYLPNPSVNLISRVRENAIGQLRSNSINLGQSLGELPEGLKFIYDTTRTVLASAIQLRKGNVSGALAILGFKKRQESLKIINEATQNAAKAALAWKFGVRPMVNDIVNIAGEIGKAMQRPDFIKVKATGTELVNLSAPSGGLVTGEVLQVVEVGYNIRPKAAYANAFLGLTNPLATAWELVPLSFVINWFVSIGDVLGALDAGVGLDVVSGYETRVTKGAYSLVYPGSVADGENSTSLFTSERKVLDAIAPPGLYAKHTIGKGQLTTLAIMARALT
uniref:Maturation protein n=1 Tax=Beihai levi-like virus 22 TaxID=1922408 RepID=A0A1L3KI54_9VIRU|nr:hypothetical protein [Beihai levi-like virus 22]APG77019.1 hypothetical protein [Beihai levi-like virus 22]